MDLVVFWVGFFGGFFGLGCYRVGPLNQRKDKGLRVKIQRKKQDKVYGGGKILKDVVEFMFFFG